MGPGHSPETTPGDPDATGCGYPWHCRGNGPGSKWRHLRLDTRPQRADRHGRRQQGRARPRSSSRAERRPPTRPTGVPHEPEGHDNRGPRPKPGHRDVCPTRSRCHYGGGIGVLRPPRRPAPQTGEGIGTVIAGRYTLLEGARRGWHGRPSIGRARPQPVRRQVALKLIKIGMDSRAVLARFDAERQDAGLDGPPQHRPRVRRRHHRGRPTVLREWELVAGEPITEYCDRRRLGVRARLALFVTVCQAVQHAHQKGIIHRDLKPSNVMVTEVDGRPTPKVIDFGVAKATEFNLTDQSLGDTGAIVGTPTYMSPEQADPSSMDIDTRTDVYALGVILYDLLGRGAALGCEAVQAGGHPGDAANGAGGRPAETEHQSERGREVCRTSRKPPATSSQRN